MGLATLLRKVGAEHGVEIDEDELSMLGLSDDEAEHEVEAKGADPVDALAMLSGEAAGSVEIFLGDAARSTSGVKLAEKDGLLWGPIIREGQWAVRPGANGQKNRRPLRVVAGHSKDARKEIGLADLLAAHNEDAVEHVTVPTSHDNKQVENTGFVRKMKIVTGTVKDKLTKKDKKVQVLMGGYDILEPDIKKKVTLGTIANRSAGILYDYVNTETGKKYAAVVEHVALTNKPWITGMQPFGRALTKGVKASVGLSLSDEEPADEDLLAQEDALESIELAATSDITWDKEDDPDWLRAQVSCRLTEARGKKVAALPQSSQYSDYPPSYRCVKARPGLALISDGWGDESNMWTAPITVTDGEVVLNDDYKTWTPSKRVFIADADRNKGFEEGEEPLSQDGWEPEEPLVLSQLELARIARSDRSWTGERSSYASDEDFADACAIDLGEGSADRFALPFKAKSGAPSAKGVQSSITALLANKSLPAPLRQTAARKLITAAGKVGVEVSDALRTLAGQKAAPKDSKTNASSQTPRGGEKHMAGTDALQLSEEARKEFIELREQLSQERKRNEAFAATLEEFKSDKRTTRADAFVAKLQKEGFDEQHGFAGVLKVVRELALSDDGAPAIVSEHFSTDDNREGNLTITQAVEKIFDAFSRGEDGKLAVAESLSRPSVETLGKDGKPAPDEKDESQLSGDELFTRLAKDNPEMVALMHASVPKVDDGKAA